MRFKFFSVSIVFAVIVAAVAVSVLGAALPVAPQTVQFKSGDDTISGYLSLPQGSGRHPGIVAIHEWWGLTDWVKQEADLLAAQGYVVLAVDLYRGKVASDPTEAHELMRGLPQDRAVRDLDSAFHYLAARTDVNAKHIGSIGWCMGGGYSLQLAVHEPKLAACVVNYGSMPTDPGDIAKINARVLGNFGAMDRGITPADVSAFEKAMRASGKSVDVKEYPDAGHGFQNPVNKDGYNPADTADAWKRIVAFYKQAL
jgi:carboxymethylenebutenolidase